MVNKRKDIIFTFEKYTRDNNTNTGGYEFKYSTRRDRNLEEAILGASKELAEALKKLTEEGFSSLITADTKKLSDIIYSSLK